MSKLQKVNMILIQNQSKGKLFSSVSDFDSWVRLLIIVIVGVYVNLGSSFLVSTNKFPINITFISSIRQTKNQSVEMIPLKDLAFETFYKQLVCKATPSTVEFVRECIEQQLSGEMKETIRYGRIVANLYYDMLIK